MKEGYIRRFFPGGNTSKGYVSFFDDVLPWENAKKFFIMKGGPGVGKSTFIQKLGERMVKDGIDIEFLHCSADSDSLDGMILPEYGIAIIDGTAPHVVDPKYPGCMEEIINFGDSWDEKGIIKHKSDIIKLQKEISKCYKKGFDYIKAAKVLHDEIQEIYFWATDEGKLKEIMEEIVGDILCNVTRNGRISRQRKMFASAISSGGLLNFLENNFRNVEKRYILKGEITWAKAKLIEAVFNTALIKGFDVEAFYCPLSPERVEHIIIKDLNLGLINSIEPHVFSEIKSNDRLIDFEGFLIEREFEKHRSDVEFSRGICKTLIDEAVACFTEAKKLHDELESFYISNMDFSKIDGKLEYVYKILVNLL